MKGGEHGQALQTRRGQQASRALRRDRAAWWSCKQSPQCPNRPWRSPSSDPGGGTPLEARKLIQPPAPSASGFFHAPASMPIRLFSRCSHCRRRGGRRETQQNGVLFGVGRGSPAPEGGEAEWSAAARQGNEKETARASPPFGAGCFWLYTSSMNCDRSVHAPSELNRPSRQPVPVPCSASSSAGTSAAFRTALPARIRLP